MILMQGLMELQMKNNDKTILKSWEKSNLEIAYPKNISTHECIVGSVMGCFVGDGKWNIYIRCNTLIVLFFCYTSKNNIKEF